MADDARTARFSSQTIEMLESPIDPDLVQFNDFNPRNGCLGRGAVGLQSGGLVFI